MGLTCVDGSVRLVWAWEAVSSSRRDGIRRDDTTAVLSAVFAEAGLETHVSVTSRPWPRRHLGARRDPPPPPVHDSTVYYSRVRVDHLTSLLRSCPLHVRESAVPWGKRPPPPPGAPKNQLFFKIKTLLLINIYLPYLVHGHPLSLHKFLKTIFKRPLMIETKFWFSFIETLGTLGCFHTCTIIIKNLVQIHLNGLHTFKKLYFNNLCL